MIVQRTALKLNDLAGNRASQGPARDFQPQVDLFVFRSLQIVLGREARLRSLLYRARETAGLRARSVVRSVDRAKPPLADTQKTQTPGTSREQVRTPRLLTPAFGGRAMRRRIIGLTLQRTWFVASGWPQKIQFIWSIGLRCIRLHSY